MFAICVFLLVLLGVLCAWRSVRFSVGCCHRRTTLVTRIFAISLLICCIHDSQDQNNFFIYFPQERTLLLLVVSAVEDCQVPSKIAKEVDDERQRDSGVGPRLQSPVFSVF